MRRRADFLEYICVLTSDDLVLAGAKSVLQYIISFMFFDSLFFSILWKNVDMFSTESVTEILILKVVGEGFFDADTVRNSSSAVLSDFLPFPQTHCFSFARKIQYLF